LTREKGDTKEFRRLVLRSFGKRRRETKRIQAVSPWRILFEREKRTKG